MNLEILYEDADVIVCYKPSGIPTQTARLGEPDMVSLLKNYLYKKSLQKAEPYLAVVHRLDQPVEGILVFAKSQLGAKELNQSLQGDGFSKHYQAVLNGIPREERATLVDYMVKDGRTNVSRIATPKEANAKEARLFYQVVATGEVERMPIARVDILLDTGRHHQIRLQMSHMGCPILGDSKYGDGDQASRKKRQLALCAYRLEFVHPRSKKRMEFEIQPRGEGFLLLDKS